MHKPKKEARQEAIKNILSSGNISSQGELMDELRKHGYSQTQATLSRDMKQLKVAKATDSNGKQVYVLPTSLLYRRVPEEKPAAPQPRHAGLLSVEFSGNLAVVHTLPGHASAIALAIDNGGMTGVAGTLAGDDTILMVLREDASREQVFRQLYGMFKEPGADA